MQRYSRARRNLAVILALCVAAIGFGAQPAFAAEEGNKAFNGYSHDIKTYNALGVLQSGPVSAAGVGCSDRAPLFYSVGLANVALAGVTLGTSNTTSQASKVGNVQTVKSTFVATAVNLPLLGGFALTADAITVTSTVNYDTVAQTFTNASTMNVTNLKVQNGLLPPVISLTGTVAPDSDLIDIPGVATVGFHRTQVLGSNAAGVMGKMATGVSVQILGQAVSIAIGETYSALYGTPDENWLFGAAEGLKVTTSDALLAVGPVVTAQVPCAGGDPVFSSLASLNLGGNLGSVGALESLAEGERDGSNATATTTSEVLAVNLAGGLVTADAVGSTSRAETTDGGQTVSTDGSSSTFVNLSVAGVPISADTAPNTVIQLPTGLGYVVVNGRTEYQSGIEMIPLVVHLNPVVGVTPAIDVVIARTYAFVLGPNTSAAAAAKATALMSEDGTLQSAITDELTKGELAKSKAAPKGLAKGWDKVKPDKKNKDR